VALVMAIGIALVVFSSLSAFAQDAEPSAKDIPSCTLMLELTGSIGPGALDYIERGLDHARTQNCHSILMTINTPGGALTTTRLIVSRILESPIPFLCLVSPEGGHAGSAGAIILMACHVNGAVAATNIGAATPISGSGIEISKDLRAKIVQDTVSWMVGLARLRGRSLEFADKVITDAKALDAEAAFKAHVIDVVVPDAKSFLNFADGRVVAMAAGKTEKVKTGALVNFNPDMRTRFLQVVTDPELAYLIFMVSLALLYFEFTHAGIMVPGVVGGIGLLIALIAFHHLDVRWGGAALIALGLAFLLVEAFVPAYGSLGIGGIIAFAFGSLLLFDPGPSGAPLISPVLVFSTCAVLGAFMLSLAYMAFRTRHMGPARAEKALLGKVGEVLSLAEPSHKKGFARVQGEIWKIVSDRDLRINDKVTIIRQEGLTLVVSPIKE
jgi:membrane-bound serine protease (ClpP class)